VTPRRAGVLSGVVMFAVMAVVAGAVTIARSATGAVDADSGGEFALALVIRVVPFAVATGVLVACVAGSTRGRLAAMVAAISSYCVTAVWMRWQSTNSPRAGGEDPVSDTLGLLATFVTVGTGLALTVALLAWWVACNAVGRDGAERVLTLETTSLHGTRDRWGAAMRAELASIDDPRERGRFARSAAAVAFRRGTGWWPVVLAALAGVCAGVVVFNAARISFDRPRDRGIIGEPIMGLVVLILVVAVITGTMIGKSFRAGLETAVLAWLAVYFCTVAVEVPQALAWYNDDGILLLDGEGAAGAGVDAIGAAFQPLTHFAFVFMSAAQLGIAVLAAAFGAMVLRVMDRFDRPHHTDSRAISE